jgi:hypothetical protein
MGWLLKVIWVLGWALIEFLGNKYDWVKEEINSKPKSDVL